jgi:hypothetical protein
MSEGERRRLVRAEFERVDLGDERRRRRALAVAERLATDPEASLPAAMGHRSVTEGLYRHLSNPRISLGALLAPHVERTVARVAQTGVAYAISDTTEFTFTGETRRSGLGPINTSAQGFLAHVTLAVSADGSRTPLGLLAVEAWARKEIKHTRKRPIWGRRRDGTRESLKWWRGIESAASRVPATHLIHVADRDSDMYEVLAQLQQEGLRFILRAAQDRRIVAPKEGDARFLFDAAQTTPTQYTVEVPVSARGAGHNRPTSLKKRFPKRGSRIALLSVASRTVTLRRPMASDPEFTNTLEVNIVHAFELGPPPGQAPVEWLLFTSESIDTPARIAAVLEGYRARWVVEEYFKAVKTGCAFETRQLESFHTLTNLLAFTLVIAYALLLMRARSGSGASEDAAALLSPTQLRILRACAHGPLPKDATVRDALLAIAALGGHLPSNGDPGWRVLSRGWRKLIDYERGFAIARRCRK